MTTTKVKRISDFQFFYANAGYSWDSKTETRQQGRAKTARMLVAAEIWARETGVYFEWVPDPDADTSWMSDDLRADNQNAFGCVCRDAEGTQLESLWGIFEPSAGYRRVVQAELALEAMPE